MANLFLSRPLRGLRISWWAAGILAVIIMASWIITKSLTDYVQSTLVNDTEGMANVLTARLRNELNKADQIAVSLSASPLIGPALEPGTPDDIEKANLTLERYCGSFDMTACYLLNADGAAIASSNRNAPESFVGKDYRSSAYFIQAFSGLPGGFFAIGTTPGERGYYASYPVRDLKGKIIGVAVVKKTLEDIETNFRNYSGCYLIDPNGIIFVSSQSDLLFRALWPLDVETRKELLQSRQFGDINFDPILPEKIYDGQTVYYGGKRWYVKRSFIGVKEWSIALFSPLISVLHYRMFSAVITLFLCALVIVFFVFYSQRERLLLRAFEEKEKAQRYLDVAGVMMVVIGVDGKIIQMNRKGCEILGRGEGEIIGKNWFENFIPQRRAEIADAFFKRFAAGEYEKFEFDESPVLTKKGEERVIAWHNAPIRDNRGKTTAMLSSGEDITERKRAEGRLQLFNKLINQSNDEIFVIDPETGYFLDVNDKACGDLGFRREEFLEMRITDVLAKSVDATSWENYVKELKEKEYMIFEDVQRRKDGSMYQVEVNVKYVSMGEKAYMVSLVRDITDRKKMEAELIRHRDHLEDLVNERSAKIIEMNEKLKLEIFERIRADEERKKFEERLVRLAEEAAQASKAKSQFIANMSHELRTPLNAVLGFSQVMETEAYGKLNEKQKEFLKDIIGSGQQLLSLIDDVLHVSQIETGSMELNVTHVKLKDILENARILQREKALSRSIKFEFKIAPDLPGEITGDPRKIKQVLFNLLSNAFKFTPDGGEIEVAAKKLSDSEIQISVSDCGPGITKKDKERLFTQFMKLDEKKPGAGLGLYLSRQMVHLWNGKIGVESPPEGKEKGCRFYFTIPLGLK